MLAAALLFIPETYREGLGHGVRATVLRPFLAVQQGAADRHGRFGDAARLRAERDSLAVYLIGQSTLAAENRELRQLLNFRERLTYSFAAGEASRDPGIGSHGLLRLNTGARDGVTVGAGVITAEGLVGKVYRVGEESSVVMDWTHPEFRASAMTLDGETYGIAVPVTGSSGERMLALSPVAFHTVPDSGAMIVTSGDGGLLPRGIPLGKVVGEGQTPAGWQRTYLIRPMVSPARMANVLVLGEPTRAPTDEDLAAAWGIRLDGAAERDTAAVRVAPDAATPAGPPAQAPAAAPAQPRTQPRPQPRRVDPTPELPGRPVFPDEPRVPEGQQPPAPPPGGTNDR